MKLSITAFLLTASLFACGAPQAQPATPASQPAASGAAAQPEAALSRLTIEEVSARIAAHDGTQIFDNNSEQRYAQGHVPGARHVSYDQLTAATLPADHGTPLVFYCGNEQCQACHHAARQAMSLGYHNVFIMPAGIMGWTQAGRPVVAGPNPS